MDFETMVSTDRDRRPFHEVVADEYGRMAAVHLQAGLDIARKANGQDRPHRQVAISNLCHAIESAAKALLAKDYLPSLFVDLPVTDARRLMRPEYSHKLKRVIMRRQKMLGFHESLVAVQEIRASAQLPVKAEYLRDLRNFSIHAQLDLDGPTIEMAAVTAIWFVNLLAEEGLVREGDKPTGPALHRLATFLSKRQVESEIVVKRLNEARKMTAERADRVPLEPAIDIDDPTVAPFECPICDATAMVTGKPWVDWYYSDPEDPYSGVPLLLLRIESFICKHCGLKLEIRMRCDLSGHVPEDTEGQVDGDDMDSVIRDMLADDHQDMLACFDPDEVFSFEIEE